VQKKIRAAVVPLASCRLYEQQVGEGCKTSAARDFE